MLLRGHHGPGRGLTDDFFDKRNRVILFSIGPTAMMGREEDFHDELKAMRKKRSE